VALGILLGVSSAIVGCRLYDRGIVIEITQQQIQERLAESFPISRDYLVVLRLTLSDPEVALKEGSDRIGFGVSATTNIKVNGEDLRGKVGLTSGVRFERDEGTLLLVDPKVEQVAISLLPQRYEEEVLLAANLAADEFLEGYEIYNLDRTDLKRLAKLVLQEAAVKNGVLRVKLGLGE
jgi:hypothetical protein